MTRSRSLLLVALLLACELNPHGSPREVRATAARRLTQRYAQSPLAPWNVRARAAGRDCDVLLVDTSVIMGDSMIEALHYGGGVYSVDGAGVGQFCRARAFRGVAYKDSTDRVWTYGNVTAEEAQTLKRCD
jgi:hypothetical protein